MGPFLLLLLQLIAVYTQDAVTDKSPYLTDEDFKRAELHPSDPNEQADVSAMYGSGLFEGDIANPGLTAENAARFYGGGNRTKVGGVMRNAIRGDYWRWPGGRIPYIINSWYDENSRAKIAEAIADYNRLTCIRFTPKTDDDNDYVHIYPGNGCSSIIGKLGGEQILSLGPRCLHKGTILHEMMHAVGFFHEQSRTDRDDYVIIRWENIAYGFSSEFKSYPVEKIDALGTHYDYYSVMHYAATTFSANGQPTIEPKQHGVKLVQRNALSQTDTYKINRLYNCQQPQPGTQPRPEPTKPEISVQTTKTPGGRPSKCGDHRHWCKLWADSGMCSNSHATYMRKYCGSSCRLC